MLKLFRINYYYLQFDSAAVSMIQFEFKFIDATSVSMCPCQKPLNIRKVLDNPVIFTDQEFH